MSPILRISLSILGVLLMGLPLYHLTIKAAPQKTYAALPPAQAQESINARIRYTAKPQSIILRYQGKVILQLISPPEAEWQGQLELPAQAAQIEVEIEAQWPDGKSGAQAASLELSPAKRSSQEQSLWLAENESLLHDIFIFSW